MAIYSMGRRRVIALLVLSSILLITLDTRGNAVIDRTRGVFSFTSVPYPPPRGIGTLSPPRSSTLRIEPGTQNLG